MNRHAKRLLLLVGIGAAVFAVVKFVATPYVVVGESMTPTLKSWDLCLMVRVYDYQPKRGDIVVFRTANDPPLHFVKRVIALPGETVVVNRGEVAVNGVPLPEPYTSASPDWDLEPTAVPAGKVFVVGDNREGSLHFLVSTRLVQARLIQHWRWRK